MDPTLPTNAVFFGVNRLRVYGPIAIVQVALPVGHGSSAASVKGPRCCDNKIGAPRRGVALIGRGS